MKTTAMQESNSPVSNSMIEMKQIVKRYYIGQPNELQILNEISLQVDEGQFVSIVGESGSGKSTLMNIIGALDRPTSGSYFLEGMDIANMRDVQLSNIRNRRIGFVFQNFYLIPRTSALKNVEIPMMYAGISRRERRERAEALLETVGMKDRMSHKPNELSGGQNQRVAIARAMSNNPAIILADEPTGALDSKTGHMVMDLFHKLHEENNKTIILITHSQELAKETERIITLCDGSIEHDTQGGV